MALVCWAKEAIKPVCPEEMLFRSCTGPHYPRQPAACHAMNAPPTCTLPPWLPASPPAGQPPEAAGARAAERHAGVATRAAALPPRPHPASGTTHARGKHGGGVARPLLHLTVL